MQWDYKHTVHASVQSQPLYLCARSLQSYWPKVITPLKCPFKKKLAPQLQRGQLDDGLQLQSLFIDLNFQGKILASYIALGKWWIIKKIWGSIYFSSTSEIFAPEFLLLHIKLFLLILVSIAFHFTLLDLNGRSESFPFLIIFLPLLSFKHFFQGTSCNSNFISTSASWRPELRELACTQSSLRVWFEDWIPHYLTTNKDTSCQSFARTLSVKFKTNCCLQ